MSETIRFRLRIVGIALSLLGTNLPIAALFLVFAGVTGPLIVLEFLWWGGLGLSIIGVGVILLFRKRKFA
jgi:hypothetical protein